ncbi:hypothetical protein [Streptomyces sp. NPDC006739]|uniref:hypothetical protein n=1 Tax=Streptomyces sp. NPDC006739 TaxID=3364763 RepID=UPI0036A9AC39
MPDHVSTLQLAGGAVLTVAAVAWLIGVTHLLRRVRREAMTWYASSALPTLPALPRQRRPGPPREAVELTPAEQDAFAGLLRQLDRP